MPSNLLSREVLCLAAVRTADDELGARSQMFHFVTDFDLFAAEVAFRGTIRTVVGQVLV